MDNTLYIYTDVVKHNGHIVVFGHMLVYDEDGVVAEIDYGRQTYVGYSRNAAALDYASKYVGDKALEAKIVIKTL